jgi:hypothetical protein
MVMSPGPTAALRELVLTETFPPDALVEAVLVKVVSPEGGLLAGAPDWVGSAEDMERDGGDQEEQV